MRKGGERLGKLQEMETGTLALLEGKLCVRMYKPQILVAMLLDTPGHGWLSDPGGNAVKVGKPSEYRFIAVQRSEFPNDLGKIVTRDELRALIEKGGTVVPVDNNNPDGDARHRVHHCSSCCRCACHGKGVKV